MSVRAMTEAEFESWGAASLSGYTDDIVASSGMSPSDARSRAEKEWSEYLPLGRGTPNTWTLKVIDGDRPVGSLWLGPHPQRADAAYVYDIVIDDAEQGRGYGRAAMLAAEQLVTAAGFHTIGLNVFGFNERARRLYDSLGYTVASTSMLKRL